MKQVIFATQHVRSLSEFEAHELMERVPESRIVPPAAPYEALRTDAFVIYQPNRRQKLRWGIKIARANAALAARADATVHYDGTIAEVDGERYCYVDRVQTEAEYDYHRTKLQASDRADADEPYEVISLGRSPIAPFVTVDRKTIARYYEQYRFPTWFRPFVKMRHFRFMLDTGRFTFQTRRYTDSKYTMAEKFRHDCAQARGVAKCYFSLARVADSLLERHGKGRPLDLLLLVLDVDADRDHETHSIDATGRCARCMASAQRKLERVRAIADPARVVFSGSKGYHCHYCRETGAEEMLALIAEVNANEELVDDFSFHRDGEQRFDMHRIFKVPGTVDATTACTIAETTERLPVCDQIARLGKM